MSSKVQPVQSNAHKPSSVRRKYNLFIFIAHSYLLYHQLCISNTQDLVMGIRSPVKVVTIQEEDVERVQSYTYLGIHLTDQLDRTDNTDVLQRKDQRSLFFLERLRSVCMYNRQVVLSVCCGLLFSVAVW